MNVMTLSLIGCCVPLLTSTLAQAQQPQAPTRKIVAPKDGGTDGDISAIPVIVDTEELKKQNYEIWGDVPDYVSKDDIIRISRICYYSGLGNALILKRHILYGGHDVSTFWVVPARIRRHPEKEGLQLECIVRPRSFPTGEPYINLNRTLIESWHYHPDGTFTFEGIVKVLGTNDEAIPKSPPQAPPFQAAAQKIVVPAAAATDADISGIPALTDRKDLEPGERYDVWGDVPDYISKDEIMKIDRFCYLDGLRDIKLLKRRLLYGQPDIPGFSVCPARIRRHPEKEGFQVDFHLRANTISTPKRDISLNMGLAERWHLRPDGTLAYERIVKTLGFNSAVMFGRDEPNRSSESGKAPGPNRAGEKKPKR